MKKTNNAIAIKLVNVSKEYILHHEKPTLVEKFSNRREEHFLALKNINLTINKGENIGIIGPNGSGKTTLLKLIARITSPTSGTIETHGRIISLIDLEAGFHSDLTGEENIYLNGIFLGMKRQEVAQKIDKIIKFADIKQFIDAPLFTYSTGMKLRLGFAVALYSNPDILILDEGMAVGDQDFQVKSRAKIQEFFRKKVTVIIVSHAIPEIKKNCKRVISIKLGKIVNDAKMKNVTF